MTCTIIIVGGGFGGKETRCFYLSAAAAVAAMKYEHIAKFLLMLITMFGVKYISQRPLTWHLNTDVLSHRFVILSAPSTLQSSASSEDHAGQE